MYRNQDIAEVTVTDAGVVNLDPTQKVDGVFEGSILFTATPTSVSGTLSVSAQLQGSNDAAFTKGVVDLGAPVVLSDGVTDEVPLAGNTLHYAYYRVKLTGAGTQSTTVVGTYTMKGRG